MSSRPVALLLLLALPGAAGAHALDEYLQATIIAVEKDHLRISMRLVPGIQVLPVLLKIIDTDSNRVLSRVEQLAYADKVRRDITLRSDTLELRPELVTADFPAIAAMREGLGEIRLEFTASFAGNPAGRSLAFDNRHLPGISTYLVNTLASSGGQLRIASQQRSPDQSHYELGLVQ